MALEQLGRNVKLVTDDDESDNFKRWWDAIDLPEASVSTMELTRTATAITASDPRLDSDQGWGDCTTRPGPTTSGT